MDPLRAAIEAVNRKWMDAFVKGDSAGIGKLYTENCETMPPGSDVIVGRDGILINSYTVPVKNGDQSCSHSVTMSFRRVLG